MAYIDLSLQEFQRRFGTEEDCLEAILEMRWPRGFICPHCQHNGGSRLRCRPRVIECSSCRRQTSITSGTLFHRSHISLDKWFLAIYLFAQDKGGASASRLSRQLGINRPTVWFMLQKLRIAMSTRDENFTLAGYIELDEAFFGGRTKTGGKRKSPYEGKKRVLVMVESEGRMAGNVVMKVVSGATYEDFRPVIAKKVESEPGGQWFRTDGHGINRVVTSLGHRLNMEPVPAQKQDQSLRCVNLAISHAKRMFRGTYHNFCKVHIQRYLDEFCYRWNRRHVFGELSRHLLYVCICSVPVFYEHVVAPKPAKA